MWVFALFDLPTDTKRARFHYTRFRKALMKDGFTMMQYSVYIRHCASDENAQVHIQRAKQALPPEGEVRLIQITDKQFGRMQVFYGKTRTPTESAPAQIELF
ncbi:MAG: CRISPR-associated endonuclease Cas2 [Nitrospirota bacterium]|nr:CRISPR-associated endonuclease Cas2 [Nitrospirota bacterium]